ncbi:MAG: DinB family protein [Anaerolineales bacterium]
MEELIAYRQELLLALESVIDELTKTVNGIPSTAWHQPYGLDSRTPHYTLAHLRELEARWFSVQLPRIKNETAPVLPAFEGQAWMANHYQPGESSEEILEDFSNLRLQELSWLRTLSPAGWSCMARHPWWGVHTLQWWVELQLDLSRQHLTELASVLDI